MFEKAADKPNDVGLDAIVGNSSQKIGNPTWAHAIDGEETRCKDSERALRTHRPTGDGGGRQHPRHYSRSCGSCRKGRRHPCFPPGSRRPAPSGMLTPPQSLGAQSLGRLGSPLGSPFQVEVHLHWVNTADPILNDSTLEDAGIVRDHQPEICPRRFLQKPQALKQAAGTPGPGRSPP